MSLNLLHYSIISYFLLLPVIINIFNWQNSYIAMIFGGVFVVFQIIIFGQAIAPKRSFARQFGFGSLLLIISIMTMSALLYWFWNLSLPALSLIYLLIPVIGILLQKFYAKSSQKRLDIFQLSLDKFKLPRKTSILLVAYILLMLLIVSQLISGATTGAILSPFEVLPNSFWLIYFLSTVLFMLIVWDKPFPSLTYVISAFHIFISLSIAVFIYKLGYGFDPFIHQATESLIASNGLVTPKTPYYLGQYGLVVSLHHLLGLSIVWLDRLLVPLLTALSLPLFWLEFVSPQTDNKQLVNNGSWLALTILLIPFSLFVVTTPQGLANLLFIWIIIASFPLLTNSSHIWALPWMWLTCLAILLTHPLTGIPALIITGLITYEIYKDKMNFPNWLHRSIYAEFLILGSLSVSLMFLFHGYLSEQFTTRLKPFSEINFSEIASWWPINSFLAETQFRSLFFEFGYFISENIWWLLSLTLLAIAIWLWTRGKLVCIRIYGLGFIIILLNAIIVSTFLEFPEIIRYESNTYASRLFLLAFWTLLPLLALALIWLYKKIQGKSMLFSWLIIIFIAWVITGNLFASYPRNNRYELGHQYSTGSSDIKTVQKIGQHKTNFVVLANQSVSAAAIKEYGFKTYYEVDGQSVFYYPVPTSSPLYQIYLDMVYDRPSRDNAQKAVDLTGVSSVYLVINEYWDSADTVIQQAKLEADEWVTIDEGKAVIFTYRF